MLAAEYQTLREPMRDAVLDFFHHNEKWLEGILQKGRSQGTLHFERTARDEARMIVAGLEGAMLVARPYDDTGRFEMAASHTLHDIVTTAANGTKSRKARR
jgi:TetR/AcrR family transcriptional repressor of nem operon